MNCQSCGMPMNDTGDHGGANPTNPYCQYCTDDTGTLKSKEEVRQGLINYYMQTDGLTVEQASLKADERMSSQPAWMQQPAETVQEPVVSAPEQPVAPVESTEIPLSTLGQTPEVTTTSAPEAAEQPVVPGGSTIPEETVVSSSEPEDTNPTA
jgi:hypothetical protein